MSLFVVDIHVYVSSERRHYDFDLERHLSLYTLTDGHVHVTTDATDSTGQVLVNCQISDSSHKVENLLAGYSHDLKGLLFSMFLCCARGQQTGSKHLNLEINIRPTKWKRCRAGSKGTYLC